MVPRIQSISGSPVLVNLNSALKLSEHKCDLAGRVITAKLKLDTYAFQIINVYAPNSHSERERFFDNLWRFKFNNLETIVTGDFNCIPDVTLDKWGGDDRFGKKAVSQLHALVSIIARPLGTLITM